MGKHPRNYPSTIAGPETSRPMTRGEKRVSFEAEGRTFTYLQPGWWCSLDDPNDMEGQLVDDDNRIAEMVRRAALHAPCEGEIMQLSLEGQRTFVEAILNPPEPTAGLRRAFERHRELIDNSNLEKQEPHRPPERDS